MSPNVKTENAAEDVKSIWWENRRYLSNRESSDTGFIAIVIIRIILNRQLIIQHVTSSTYYFLLFASSAKDFSTIYPNLVGDRGYASFFGEVVLNSQCPTDNSTLEQHPSSPQPCKNILEVIL